jgi:LAO/AO transport system kinase
MSPVAAAGSVEELADGVLAGQRAAVAQAITLVESRRADHREQAQRLLARLLPHTGRAIRVGVSGVPGVGKSTFIDQLGVNLIVAGHRVAVLAVDPSSARTGGSILGDKTRMTRLANDEHAFVRPSPSAGTLGGVAKATRETMLIMEAAGYDVVLVETVGVGQSEYVVADMVDTFLFLSLARTGDQLQGMKRGILELADVIAVNKADEQHEHESERAARELSGALRFVRGTDEDWQTPVITCSGLHDVNLDRVWKHVLRHRAWLDGRGREDADAEAAGGSGAAAEAAGGSGGGLERKRREQLVHWTRAMVRDRLLARLDEPGTREAVSAAEAAVLAGQLTPDQAATRILAALDAR